MFFSLCAAQSTPRGEGGDTPSLPNPPPNLPAHPPLLYLIKQKSAFITKKGRREKSNLIRYKLKVIIIKRHPPPSPRQEFRGAHRDIGQKRGETAPKICLFLNIPSKIEFVEKLSRRARPWFNAKIIIINNNNNIYLCFYLYLRAKLRQRRGLKPRCLQGEGASFSQSPLVNQKNGGTGGEGKKKILMV